MIPLSATPSSVSPNAYTGEYEVQPGDTLSEIAERSGFSETEIAEINEIPNVDYIEVGDVLSIGRTCSSRSATAES